MRVLHLKETTDPTKMNPLSLKKKTRGVTGDHPLGIDVVLRTEDRDPGDEEEDPGQETTTEGEAEAVTGEVEAGIVEVEAGTEEEIVAGKEWKEKGSVKEETENGGAEKKEKEKKGNDFLLYIICFS